jgi:hypothetical protein
MEGIANEKRHSFVALQTVAATDDGADAMAAWGTMHVGGDDLQTADHSTLRVESAAASGSGFSGETSSAPSVSLSRSEAMGASLGISLGRSGRGLYDGDTTLDGVRHGHGTLTSMSGDTVYVGDFHHGAKHGWGAVKRSNGETYDGEWASNKKHGTGRFTYADGTSYEGGYSDNKRHGHGVMVCSAKLGAATYSGEWQLGEHHGAGTMSREGSCYVGEFADGKRHGAGRLSLTTAAGAEEYDGEWRGDAKDGYGTLLYADGAVYCGLFADNDPQGHGRYERFVRVKTDTGDESVLCWTYDGTFSNGLRHGAGRLHRERDDAGAVLADPHNFEGDWREDKRHGRGRLCVGSTVWEGEWYDDVYSPPTPPPQHSRTASPVSWEGEDSTRSVLSPVHVRNRRAAVFRIMERETRACQMVSSALLAKATDDTKRRFAMGVWQRFAAMRRQQLMLRTAGSELLTTTTRGMIKVFFDKLSRFAAGRKAVARRVLLAEVLIGRTERGLMLVAYRHWIRYLTVRAEVKRRQRSADVLLRTTDRGVARVYYGQWAQLLALNKARARQTMSAGLLAKSTNNTKCRYAFQKWVSFVTLRRRRLAIQSVQLPTSGMFHTVLHKHCARFKSGATTSKNDAARRRTPKTLIPAAHFEFPEVAPVVL